MRRSLFSLALSACALAAAGSATRAGIIDTFDTQPDPMISVFGGSPVTATATFNNVAGDWQMTLTESPNNKDSGFVWRQANGQRIPATADYDTVSIESIGPATPGSRWDIVVEFSNVATGGTLVAYPDVYGDITKTGTVTFSISDVAKMKDRNGATGAGALYYDLKIRTQPYSQAGYAWTYTTISATPEPAAVGVVGTLGLGLLRRRRAR